MIDLQPAYYWLCPACESDNFLRVELATVDDMDDQEVDELREGLDLQPWQDTPQGVFCRYPCAVRR